MKKLRLEELGRITVDQFRTSSKLPVMIVLDNVRSLHNVGSAFRTSDAFRVEGVVLTGITGQPPHREIEKTALGATQSVSWEYFETTAEAVRVLKGRGYRIVVVEQTTASTRLHDFAIESGVRYCLVFGNEIHGVSEEAIEIADAAIEIPQYGTKHSLNIAVCLGIVTWEFFKKLSL